jgi:hypothetical protein
MADLKISQLTGATTPLAGTEVLPIVQSSTTKKVTVADLTTGRAISATQLTLTTGNLIVANGQGIDFSDTPGTGTSELLADYEEGTWTPSLTAGSGTITSFTSQGRYTKNGRLVTAEIEISITDNGTGATGLIVGNFPFTAFDANALTGATREHAAAGFGIVGSAFSTTSIYLTKVDGTYPGGTGYAFAIVVSYSV